MGPRVNLQGGGTVEAEKLLVQVIEASLRELGVKHPDTLITMGYRDQDESNCMFKVTETSPKVLGAKHPDTLVSTVEGGELEVLQVPGVRTDRR